MYVLIALLMIIMIFPEDIGIILFLALIFSPLLIALEYVIQLLVYALKDDR